MTFQIFKFVSYHSILTRKHSGHAPILEVAALHGKRLGFLGGADSSAAFLDRERFANPRDDLKLYQLKYLSRLKRNWTGTDFR